MQEYYSLEEFGVDTVEGRCRKCGSRRHTAGSCTVDVSKIRCFRCGKAGHVSYNCTSRPESGKGKGGEKGKSGLVKSDMWDKKGSKGVKGSKGSKGKGKKGKLNEGSEDWTDWTAESWDDDDYWWNDQWPESCDGQWGVSQTWWDDGSGWYCDGYGYTWQQEPVQSAEMSVSHDNRSDVQKTGSVGSMIINPLLYDLTCETTGGLRFVHEHDLEVDSLSCGSRCGCNGAELEFADMETENRLVVDCKEFESKLADTGCVLARGCDSCTHESEFSEDELADTGCVLARGCDSCTRESEVLETEVADMGCVLARSCDSCTHEPWFCGLKCGDEVGLGDSSSLETRFANDPSRDLCATVPMKVVLVRAHDWFDDHSEVSVEQQVEPYLKFLRPLLSQVADNTDASWWLLDSGASTSVLAESNLSAFRSVRD